MRTWPGPLAIGLVVLLAGTPALAQSISIDMAGMGFFPGLFTPPPDQSENSSPSMLPVASGYQYDVNGVVSTSGLAGSFIPNGSTLAEVLDIFAPGNSRLLTGYVRNDAGTLPTDLFRQRFSDIVSGFEVGFTFIIRLNASGVGYIEFEDIAFPFLAGSIEVTSGTCEISTWTPSPLQETEWHFDGDLTEFAGPSRLRYLDDPAFGDILDGTPGNTYIPNPTTPKGVTQAQSSFGTTTSFGIPDIGGEEATVYKTSPSRNLSQPTNEDWRRGVGLTVWPRTRTTFPGELHGQWTMIWDLYIPNAAWASEYPVALMHDTQNNDELAMFMIRKDPVNGGTIGFAVNPGSYLVSNLIQPETWLRIVAACNFSQGRGTRIFVNGQFIGATGADWLYNFTDKDNPEFSDGTAVPPMTWMDWGMHPSPWATTPNSSDPDLPFLMSSNFGLFADQGGGRGESVYLANFYFSDGVMSDSEAMSLGGPDAAGIKFIPAPNCPGDANGDQSVDINDLNQVLGNFGTSVPVGTNGDVSGDGMVDITDLNLVLGNFGESC